jgi:hypothetical protein
MTMPNQVGTSLTMTHDGQNNESDDNAQCFKFIIVATSTTARRRHAKEAMKARMDPGIVEVMRALHALEDGVTVDDDGA